MKENIMIDQQCSRCRKWFKKESDSGEYYCPECRKAYWQEYYKKMRSRALDKSGRDSLYYNR